MVQSNEESGNKRPVMLSLKDKPKPNKEDEKVTILMKIMQKVLEFEVLSYYCKELSSVSKLFSYIEK